MWRTKRPIREGSFLLKEREQPFYEFHVAYSFTGLYRRQSRSNGAHTARFGHPRAISVTIFASQRRRTPEALNSPRGSFLLGSQINSDAPAFPTIFSLLKTPIQSSFRLPSTSASR
jgi:hypothetical protein